MEAIHNPFALGEVSSGGSRSRVQERKVVQPPMRLKLHPLVSEDGVRGAEKGNLG